MQCLSLPAAHETVGTWMHGFGFTHMPAEQLRAARAELRLLLFPGTEVLVKPLAKPLTVMAPTPVAAAASVAAATPLAATAVAEALPGAMEEGVEVGSGAEPTARVSPRAALQVRR